MTDAAIPVFLPWQHETAQRWLADRERFAHAWLIHGLSGIGKTQFALAAATALLCENPQSGMACGRCSACKWVALGKTFIGRRDKIAHTDGSPGSPDSPEGSDNNMEKSADLVKTADGRRPSVVTPGETELAYRALRTASWQAVFFLITTGASSLLISSQPLKCLC